MGLSLRGWEGRRPVRKMIKTFVPLCLALFAGVLLAQANQDIEGKNYITCTLCKDIIQIADDFITGNSTISQVEDALHQACAILGILAETCNNFVDENVEGIIDGLVNDYLEPEQFCTSISLCP